MNPDLQSMSDWLRVNLLGEVVSRAHEWLGGMCYNCKIGKNSDAAQKPCPKGRYKPPPLLSAPEQYWRVIEAMLVKDYAYKLQPTAPARHLAICVAGLYMSVRPKTPRLGVSE